jgi:hypothetical protein
MKYQKLFLFILTGLFLISCNKDENTLEPAVFSVTTGVDLLLNGTSTVAYGKVRITSGSVSEHGFCWSEYQNPILESDRSINLGTTNESTEFSAELDDLKMSTNYFLRTYAKDANGITYGNEIAFRTSDVNINNIAIWNNTPTSATLAVGLDVTTIDPVQFGFCWALHDNPLVSDNKVEVDNLSDDKVFFTKITNLEPNKNYYFRAYCLMGGMIYSKVTKLFLPSFKINNLSIEQTDNNSVEITTRYYSYNSTIADHGICFALHENPEITDSTYSLGNNIFNNELNIEIDDLIFDEKYFFRGYIITNNDSVIYSNPKAFDLAFPLNIPEYPGSGKYSPIDFNINGQLFYGLCRDGYTFDLWEFDKQDVIWSKKANMPFNFNPYYMEHYNESHTSNEKGYFFYRSIDNKKITACVYNPAKNEWDFLGTLSFGSYVDFMSSVESNGKIYLMVGFDYSTTIEIYEILGFNEMNLISEFEHSNYLQMSFSIGDEIYLTDSKAMYTFNPGTNSYVQKNEKPLYSTSPYYYQERWANYFMYKEEAYLSAQDKVYKYVPENDQWLQLNDFNGYSDESTTIIINDNIFIGMGEEDSQFILYKPE